MRNTAKHIQSGLTAVGATPALKVVHSKKTCTDCHKKKQNGQYCFKHAKRHYKLRHLDKYTYNALKQNAKRRRKEFTLTFTEFMQFCDITGYLVKKGQSPHNYTIDRIDHTKGYSFTNIQVLTHAENSRKGWYEKSGTTDTSYSEDDPF